MPNNVRVSVSAPGAKEASSHVDQLRDKFNKFKGEGAKGLAIGAGAAITAKGFGILDTAISGTIGLLGDAKDAYAEDQASQKKLDASIRANATSWDGNKDSLEGVLLARERLGFSDDEQRDSLSSLVTRTHDVNKALELQRTAMDLSRLRGMDLASASDLVGKAFNGQVGALRKAGIAVDAHATAAEALLAVQKAVAGQAEAYASTDAGKEEAANLKVGESMERLGEVISKVAAVGLPILADAFEFVVNTAGDLAQGVQDLLKPLADVNDFIGTIPGPWHHTADVMTGDAERVSQAFVEAGKGPQALADDARESAHLTGQANIAIVEGFGDLGPAAQDAEEEVSESYRKLEAASDGLVAKLIADKESLLHNYYDVLVTQDELMANKAEIAAQRRIIASNTATDKEKQDAREALHRLSGDRIKYLEDLATAGKTNTKAFKAGMDGLLDDLKTAHGEERKAILAEIAALKLLATQARITAKGYNNLAGIGVSGARASGGPVKAGHAYLVGENRPEVFVPDQDGDILPSVDRAAGGAPTGGHGTTGGGSFTLNATFNGVAGMSPAFQNQIKRELLPLILTGLRELGWKPG